MSGGVVDDVSFISSSFYMKRLLGSFLTLALLTSAAPLANAVAGPQGDRLRVSSDTFGVHYADYDQGYVTPTGFTFRGSQVEDIALKDIRFVTNIDADGDMVGHWGSDAGIDVQDVINSVQLVDINGASIAGPESVHFDGSIRFNNVDYILPANQLTSIYLKVDLANYDLGLAHPIEIYFDVQNVHDDISGEGMASGENRFISSNHPNFPNRGVSRLNIVY